MYSDPSLIRRHSVKLRFNDREADLLNALVAYTGEEKAAFIRELILEHAREVLRADEYAHVAHPVRGTAQPL